MFFLRDNYNLVQLVDGAYVINHNDTESKGTHWVSLRFTKIQLYTLIEYITQEALSKIKKKNSNT